MQISKNFAKLKKIIFEFSPNYILNFAAESHVDNSIVNANPFINSNIIGTFNLLQIAKNLPNTFKMFLHISTDEVFGSLSLNQKKRFSLKKHHMIQAHLIQHQKQHLIT